MALTPRVIPINFAQGMDRKTDPWQIPLGKFYSLNNSIFTKYGRLTKRYGNNKLTTLGTSLSSLSTYSNGLLAIGTSLSAYADGTQTWVNKGAYQPLNLSVETLIRSAANQTQCDTATASNGLTCVVYTETANSATSYKYAIFDSGSACIIMPVAIVAGSSGTVTGSPRVFVLGSHFVIVFTATISATPHLQYVAIPTNAPTTVSTAVDISTTYTPASTVAFDGVVANNNLYIAWNASGGAGIKMTYLDSTLTQHGTTNPDASHSATIVSVTADTTASTPVIWVTYYNSSGTVGYTFAVSQTLVSILAPVKVLSATTILNVTSSAQNGVNQIFYEVSNAYSYDGAIASNYVQSLSVAQSGLPTFTVTLASPGVFTTSSAHGLVVGQKIFFQTTGALPTGLTAGTNYFVSVVGSTTTFQVSATSGGSSINTSGSQSGTHTYIASTILIRGVGLASKSFLYSSNAYFLAAYSSTNQPSYFLINTSGQVVGKLAYSNGGGYLTLGLPSATVSGTTATIGYLFKDLVLPVNKTQAAASSSGVYSQTGVNAALFNFTATPVTAEIGGALHISGAQLWMYDGTQLVEHGFHIWPDSIECTWSASGGSIHAQPDGATNTNAYYYQVLYEWTDAAGMIHRSGVSIPVGVTTTSNGTSGSITINVPTLRETLKTNVKIVIFRWSVAQQTYYQVTSIANPTMNSTTADSVAFVDTLADASIIGNSIIYTTGGVLENIGAPATNIISLFNERLMLVDAEDTSLIWFSKQVIEAVPVEMSDSLVKYAASTQGAQGSTGPITATAPMDDKFILFRSQGEAIYYFTGTGPDIKGENNDFSEPVFITSTVSCENQNIVTTPRGLMFQSDKGIWRLGRDLSTDYVGAPVEDFNSETVLAALSIPKTNNVRFYMSGGEILNYDYFFDQWGTFTGIRPVSATLFQGYQTTLDSYGRIFQENPNSYLDGSSPVLMSFTTGWISGAGLQGYQRARALYLLGQYLSPHKIVIGVAYNENSTIQQQAIITADNSTPNYGDLPVWGSAPQFGGPGDVEQWQLNFKQQTCQSFQLTFSEQFDPSVGQPAGAGFTLSGLNLLVGLKKDYPRRLPANRRVG